MYMPPQYRGGSKPYTGVSDVPVPTGTILMHGAATAPTGYLLCDGSAYDTLTYQSLFAVIGTTYGDNGAGTFRVPNLGSRSPVGTGSSPGNSNRTLADVGGEEDHTLVIGEVAIHTHAVSDGQHFHSTQDGGGILTSNPTTGTLAFGADQPFDVADANTTNSSSNISLDTAGGNAAHNTMHPFIALAFVIKT